MNDGAVWENPSQMAGQSRFASARRAAVMKNGTRVRLDISPKRFLTVHSCAR